MKKESHIPIPAAGIAAPSILDLTNSTVPIALLKGTMKLTEKFLSALSSEERRIKMCKRAVFRIYAWNDNSSTCSTGTAFLISADGLIITNSHVIEGYSHFAIYTPNADTGGIEQLSAKPVRVDPHPDRDLAALQLSNVDFPLPTPLRLASGRPDDSEKVVAIGFPAASDNIASETMSCEDYLMPSGPIGNISKIFANQIQHTASISGGNSGGPLITPKNGKVIGVNTLFSVNKGGTVFAAVPAQYVSDLIEGKSGMIYAEYKEHLARYAKENARKAAEERHSQMDERASNIIDKHLDFITGNPCSIEPEEVYARDLVDIDRNATIHREAFVKNTIALDKTWPTRRYHLVSAKRSGETLEVLCQYYRKSRKGKVENGYSMITLVTNNGLITAFSEKHSDKPIKHTSRYKKIDYHYPPDYYAYPAN